MSVRVVARIRPLLKSELDKDSIIEATPPFQDASGASAAIVKVPNPKNGAETYSFQFQGVYDQSASQQDLYDVAPTVKHLFRGFDVTIFAYGVTGTGKTHTMRGGKTLAERGVIPRLLSSIFRKSRKIEKDTNGETKVEVDMSYYEIYNDRVFDLFEPPEKRTPAGLPIRDNNGKTIVAGLTERPCTSLKEFEQLYDQANVNRSTSATKLNAHSSRSHAILCVKVSQITPTHTTVSTASAIDLAGSEDNRRTDNNKDRLVESSSINRSLFVLAQCVEAISKKQNRIPYRESKMTRILSLGQNNGFTVMILNLAPVRSYHLDTLSSLNFANRTKKIEVREIENEPVFKGPPKQTAPTTGPAVQRQPLRPIAISANIGLKTSATTSAKDKPAKAFSVYAEKDKPRSSGARREDALKRSSDASTANSARPAKALKPNNTNTSISFKPKPQTSGMSQKDIESLVNRMVEEKLASRALNEPTQILPAISSALPEDVQRRLEALEQKISQQDDEDARSEGLHYLLMAKQHAAHGEDTSALRMYQLAQPYFPGNDKLNQKIAALQDRLQTRQAEKAAEPTHVPTNIVKRPLVAQQLHKFQQQQHKDEDDQAGSDADNYQPSDDDHEDSFTEKPKRTKRPQARFQIHRDRAVSDPTVTSPGKQVMTPRSKHLIGIINTRDLKQIRSLKGVGAKKAEAIVNCLVELDESDADDDDVFIVTNLQQLGALRGIGEKLVRTMREGVVS